MLLAMTLFASSQVMLGLNRSTKTELVTEHSTTCADRGLFCRFVKSFCNNPDHAVIMKRDCASTCNLCGLSRHQGFSNLADVTEIYLSNGLRFRHEILKNSRKNNTSKNGTYTAESLANVIRKFADAHVIETSNSTVADKIPASASLLKLSLDETSSNKQLFEDVKNTNRSTIASDTVRNQTTAVYNVPIVPIIESYEVRKLKLEELMNSTGKLPQITTTGVVSLSKTLKKGKCLDEYTYCREFSLLCVDPTFTDVMARHCTLTCKRCDDIELEDEYGAGCFDIALNCRSYLQLCAFSKYRQLMKDSCAKSCKQCKSLYKDRHRNCPRFIDDGFCNDEMYTNEERKHLCGA